MEPLYDMVVIGGGPAGYTAAMYGARAGMRVMVLEKLSAGGQIALATQVDNYPGFPEGIDGFTLGENMRAGAERFGAETELAEVYAVDLRSDPKRVETSEGTFYGKTVVLATGANPKKLGVDAEQALTGRGVSYCATCDGMLYRGKTVMVVGGGNTAVAEALALSRVAKKVFLVHRRDTLRASKIYHAPLQKVENVEFIWNTKVSGFLAGERVTGVVLENVITGERRELPCDGVFVSIGRAPATELVKEQLPLDASGYILADETTRTEIPGVFAAGDIRTKELRQVVTAVADGAAAAYSAESYLTHLE